MPASISWLDRTGRTLAEQAERLRRSLESLGQQLREGIAGEVARSVAAAVSKAVRAALDCRPVNEFRRPYARPARPSAAWDDPRSTDWSDGFDDELSDEWDGRRWDEPDEMTHRPSPPTETPVQPTVLPLGWQGLLWLLGRRGRWAALGAGLLAAAAALAGNPLLASAAAVAALVTGLLALSDTAASGAAALSRAAGP